MDINKLAMQKMNFFSPPKKNLSFNGINFYYSVKLFKTYKFMTKPSALTLKFKIFQKVDLDIYPCERLIYIFAANKNIYIYIKK